LTSEVISYPYIYIKSIIRTEKSGGNRTRYCCKPQSNTCLVFHFSIINKTEHHANFERMFSINEGKEDMLVIGKVLIIIKNDHLGTDDLKETNELKYLGLYFASSFSFNFHTYNNANSSLVHCMMSTLLHQRFLVGFVLFIFCLCSVLRVIVGIFSFGYCIVCLLLFTGFDPFGI
jgi:hypothetical protein